MQGKVSVADPTSPVSPPPPPNEAVDFMSGGCAALTNILIVFPLHKTIFVQQLQGVRWVTSAQQVFVRDFRYLFRGVLPPMCQKTASLSIMFGVYGHTSRSLHERNPSTNCVLHNAASALLAGTCEATLTPFERIQTLLQNRRYHDHFRNTFHTASEVWRAGGFREFYRGLTPILLRNGPSNVVYFLSRDAVLSYMPDNGGTALKPVRNFIMGAGLGACLGIATYPLNVAKTRMQTHMGGPFEGVTTALQAVYLERDRSLLKFYRGVVANCFRSMISWGIITMSYEWFHSILADSLTK